MSYVDEKSGVGVEGFVKVTIVVVVVVAGVKWSKDRVVVVGERVY